MERLLKDHLVDCSEGNESCFSLICTVCGGGWKSRVRRREEAKTEDIKNAAAREAAEHNHICNFCGRPVCSRCYTEVEGIALCVHCGEKLRRRMEAR